MKSAATTRFHLTVRELAALASAGALYFALQLAGWLNSPELEDHDSVRYLYYARIFRSGDWHAIVNLEPDATPLPALLTALFSFFTPDLETAGRLVSVLASLGTMIAVYLIGKRIANHAVAATAVVIYTVTSPEFYRMSYSTMSEPLYIAFFSWIVLVFVSTVDKPTLKSSITLGLLSGLAFLTRAEGILLMLAIPLLHFVHALTSGHRIRVASFAGPNLLLVLTMAVVIAPQIARVSNLMNSFALNGRSVWPVIFATQDGKSYNEKLTGLDYDPKVINLYYLQAHPEVVEDLSQELGYFARVKGYATTVVRNSRQLHDRQLVALVGLPVLIFAVTGFLALLNGGRSKDALLLGSFLAIALIPPLIYEVSLRHLLILVPLLSALAARGLVETARILAAALFSDRLRTSILCCLLLASSAVPLNRIADLVLKPDDFNAEYDVDALRRPAAIVRQFSKEADREVLVMARKTYLSYYSGSSWLIPPYTNLAGLLHFIEGRRLDFLFYEQEHFEGYPFVDEIGSELWLRHFHEVYSSNRSGAQQTLYAVRNAVPDGAVQATRK